jgi:hypothetical protein
MAVLGIRRDAFQGLSDRDRTIVRFMGDVVQLGEPARYETPTGVEWFLFADGRFRPIPIAYLGCLIANLNDIPAAYELPMIDVLDIDGNKVGERLDRATLRDQIKTWCENPARANPLVLPRDVEFTEGGNLWQELLDAQGAPSAIQMADSVPARWTPVEVNDV